MRQLTALLLSAPLACCHGSRLEGQADTTTDGDVTTAPDCLRYVDIDSGSASPDGLSWSTAYASVQDAIDDARDTVESSSDLDVCEVWVAEGTYYTFGSSSDDTVQLRPGVHLYGGFDGTESSLEGRDWESHRTVLEGHDSAGGTSRVTNVVTGSNDAVIDGFVITGGNAAGDGVGGGMRNYRSATLVRNCTFTGNSAGYGGGGMGNIESDPTIVSCTFTNNTTQRFGGGLLIMQASEPVVENCIFHANSSLRDGGALYVNYSTPTITNCTFADNTATNSGGGLHGHRATFSVTNSIFWNNTPDEISNGEAAACTATHSDVRGGYDGTGNIDADPLFADGPGGDLHLQPGSPCIDAADGDAAPETDLDGNPRYDDPDTPNSGTGSPDHADMGAFEYAP